MHVQDEAFTKMRMHLAGVQHVRSELHARLHVQ